MKPPNANPVAAGRRLIALLCALGALEASSLAAEKVTFEGHVRPILRQHCAGCHNQDDAASDFASDSYEATLAGGAGGEVLAAGDADGSRLWRLVNHDEEPAMPPGGEKLPAKQLAVLRAWIEGGLLRDANSKPKAPKRSAVAAVDPSNLGKPAGEPVMPSGVFRQPVVTAATVGPIDSLATSRWAPLIAVAWQRQVSLYDAETQRLLGVVPYLDGAPRVTRFSRDGSLLLVAGGREAASGTAALYDVATGARLVSVGDEVDTVLAADLSPDNSLIAIGGPKKKVRVYRVADGTLAYSCGKHTDWITCLAFSPDGKLLATGDRSAGLRLWQATAGHERGDLRGHKEAITALAWRGDGGLLASASEDGSARLWSPEGAAVKSWTAHNGGALSIAFAADGRLVTAGRDRRVKLWKPDGAAIREVAKTDDVALAVAFTHDDKSLVLSDWTGAVSVVGVEDAQPIGRLVPNPPTLEERLAAAGRELAKAEAGRTATQADLETALADLEAARERHAEYEARLAEAELAASDAAERLAQAESAASQRRRAQRAVEVALTEVETTLADLEAQRTDSPSDDKDAAALASQIEAAKASRDATATAAETADRLSQEAQIDLAAIRERQAAADQLLATLSNQRSGLPDLESLEQSVADRERSAEQNEESLRRALAAQEAQAEELARFQQAVETLATEQAAAAKRAEAARTAATQAAATRDAALEAEAKARQTLERMRAELAALRGRIAEQREAARATEGPAATTSAAAEQQQAALAAAERAERLLEARLETVRALRKYRAEQAVR